MRVIAYHVGVRSFSLVSFRIAALAATISFLPAIGQEPFDREVRLPSGKLQREEILKAEHEKSVREVDEIVKIANELKEELNKHGYSVLSISSIEKTKEIEKLAKRVRDRLQR